MFSALLVASIAWLVIFIASCAFDAWFELARPRFLVNNIIGRAVSAVAIAPLIITISLTAIVCLPVVAFADAIFADPWSDDSAWQDTMDTILAAWEWFTNWAPTFVLTGEE